MPAQLVCLPEGGDLAHDVHLNLILLMLHVVWPAQHSSLVVKQVSATTELRPFATWLCSSHDECCVSLSAVLCGVS